MRAVAALSLRNILAIHDFGRADDIVYAVTELLEGESLDRRLAREDLSWKQALEIGAAVADGLASAHARDVAHRDLKPANTFLTRDETASSRSSTSDWLAPIRSCRETQQDLTV